jgi:stage IV sporulation protein A
MNEFESDPERIWNSNMFGKSLYDMVKEELQGKLYKMPEDVQGKLQLTLNKVVNDSKGGIVCIII